MTWALCCPQTRAEDGRQVTGHRRWDGSPGEGLCFRQGGETALGKPRGKDFPAP